MSPFTLEQSLWIDLLCVIVCAGLLLPLPGMRHSHPAVIYLVFHAVVFTFRAWAIHSGADVMLSVTREEAAWALNVADIFLVALTVGWLSVPRREWNPNPTAPGQLDGRVVVGTAVVAVPIGLYAMSRYIHLPGSGLGGDELTTSYQTLAVTWPGLMLLALIYKFGFRIYLTVPLAGYLLLVALQGESRARLILPAILLTQIWLDRRGKRWPTPMIVVSMAALAALFYPLDQIGAQARQGELTAEEAVLIVEDSTKLATTGDHSEQRLFDMYAASLSLGEAYGSPLYGAHYLDLLVLPVPRPIWPDKPATNEHIVAISTEARPLSTIGAIVTVPGELWLDFRLPGVLLIGFIIARLSGRAHRAAYAGGYGTLVHFCYLLVAALLIEVYRDGLASLPVFLFVHNLPLVAIALLNLVIVRKPSTARVGKRPRKRRSLSGAR